jgi:hypothetical protein
MDTIAWGRSKQFLLQAFLVPPHTIPLIFGQIPIISFSIYKRAGKDWVYFFQKRGLRIAVKPVTLFQTEQVPELWNCCPLHFIISNPDSSVGR